ncbi:Os01g0741250 [Oryza sativa Japonica Group]|uniref:Os01g0741250 protein n=1 Tax=Oryza sativa subsp. japonica TaxID=39947 RepID=A0A0P0V809_ORYSJ|nr:hypothetical protein EE612_005635 [Oryza sativa]BAS74276.1 Os01g0741250 [Oryza sativa Japonica Group]
MSPGAASNMDSSTEAFAASPAAGNATNAVQTRESSEQGSGAEAVTLPGAASSPATSPGEASARKMRRMRSPGAGGRRRGGGIEGG